MRSSFFDIKRKGQVTIFVVVAIVIVLAVGLFFLFRGNFLDNGIPSSIQPVYSTFTSCVENNLKVGIDVLESQGGYIELPPKVAGSEYMPFSSQLDFLGNPIPYWYYVSGSNVAREQVPTKQLMQSQLADFVDSRVRDCIFESYYKQGFEVTMGVSHSKVVIRDSKVELTMNMDLLINDTEQSAVIPNHFVSVDSNLGKLYNTAKEVYDTEQASLFLENRAVDNIRLYAPVDGVELTCAPKTWSANNVFSDLADAISANTMALKTKNSKFDLRRSEDKYYVLSQKYDSEVRFLNSKDWSSSYSVSPAEGNLMVAKPVGTQPGLGVLGFCYVPYHFVYDVKYPVLVQVFSGDEIFQFPFAVVVLGNKPRKPLDGASSEMSLPELCDYKNTPVSVSTYDTNFNPISANISFECFGARCDIGETSSSGSLSAKFPQCVNGFIRAEAGGYSDSRYMYSTTKEGSVDIILNKKYTKRVNLNVGGSPYSGEALITFKSDEGSTTILYPDQNTVDLTEGDYEVQVYIYRKSNLNIASNTVSQCMDVPKSGIGGALGFTKKKCFDVEIPAQVVSNALSGGGVQNYYILESELINSKVVDISADALPLPVTLDQLQQNYLLFDTKGLSIEFK